MKIHRFEKAWLVVSLLLIVGFIATIVYGATAAGIEMVDDSGGQVDPEAIGEGNYDQVNNFKEPGVYKAGENHYDVYVLARQYFFQPGTSEPVTVPKGATVTFYITTPDVTHGFNLAGTNINTMVIPGQVAEITTTFEETDTYGVVCNEYCGAGHHTMAGQVKVVEQSQFNETAVLEG